MSPKNLRARDEPFNRLTRICNDLSENLERHPDRLPTDRVIIILDESDDDGSEVGMMIEGHDHPSGAVFTLLQALSGVVAALGKRMQVQLDDEVYEL